MEQPNFPYCIFPLGDTAVTIDFGNCINETLNKEVIKRFNQLRRKPLPGMIEAVPAYSSLTIYYDMMAVKKMTNVTETAFEWIKKQLEEKLMQLPPQEEAQERNIRIPVCYGKQFAMDIEHLAETNNISIEEIIQLHISKPYKVFMLGFLPGFAYMGEVDEKLIIPRKSQPVNIEPGSVGIAGKQTGIYPLSSPGGWQIIGRTPMKLFDASEEEPTLLRTGDTVQFYPVSANEFYEIQKLFSSEMRNLGSGHESN